MVAPVGSAVCGVVFSPAMWRIFVVLLGLVAAKPIFAGPPNIVLLIADDQGAEDSEPFGNPGVRTPNLARLAREGLRFDRAFVTASSCSPSRCSLISGR